MLTNVLKNPPFRNGKENEQEIVSSLDSRTLPLELRHRCTSSVPNTCLRNAVLASRLLTKRTLDELHTPHYDRSIGAILTYKTLSTCQSAYLRDLIHPYLPARSLRSQDLKLLNTPRTNLSIGRRAFSFAAPHIWNSIPISIGDSTSLHSFKRHLETFYFQSSFA